jgi:hypothetical protein
VPVEQAVVPQVPFEQPRWRRNKPRASAEESKATKRPPTTTAKRIKRFMTCSVEIEGLKTPEQFTELDQRTEPKNGKLSGFIFATK